MKNSFIFFSILLLSFLTVGDISITVQSENPKTIEVFSLNQTSVGNITEGENLSLAYNNYIVRMRANTESNIGWGNLWGFLGDINNKWVYFVIIILIVWLIISFVRSS